ncbi:MAG: hypothetical protein M1839_005945 [Geoglossum umbratile]|nr:MAG: hypothetical protein M1839_005945 [Geoglossum umbratile]
MFAAASWTILHWRLAKKCSMAAYCSGAISGLEAATLAFGFITSFGSIVWGIVTGVACSFTTKIKFWTRIDDPLITRAGGLCCDLLRWRDHSLHRPPDGKGTAMAAVLSRKL